MKKRVLALLLALALALSLAPAVMADGEPAIELYMGEETDPFQRNQDNVVIAPCGSDGSLWGLQLRAEGWSFSAMNGTVSNGRVTVCDGLVAEGKTDYLSVYCTAGDTTDPVLYFQYNSASNAITFEGFQVSAGALPEGSARYNMRICFSKPNQNANLGFYMIDPDTNTTYTKNVDGVLIAPRGKTLELRADGWTFTQLQGPLAWDTITVGNGADTSCLLVYCTAGDTNINDAYFRYSFDSTQHTVTVTGAEGVARQTICFTASDSGGGQGGNQDPFEGLTLTQESLEALMIEPAPDIFFTGDYFPTSPVHFIFNGLDYYIGVAWYADHGGNPASGGSEDYEQGEQDAQHFNVGIWTKQGVDYHPVDETQYATLYQQFDNLSITLLRGQGCTNRSPAVYHGTNDPSRITLATNATTVGNWVLQLTGTATSSVTLKGPDGSSLGNSLAAYGMTTINAVAIIKEANPASITSLDEVSEFFLTELNNERTAILNGAKVEFKFNIPYDIDGYDGNIVIPDALAGDPNNGLNCWFDIIGPSFPSGEKLTIRGKIIANSGRIRLRDINFVGTGDLDDPDNVCGIGRGDIRGENCVFSKYSCAMKCTPGTCLKWGFDRCVFQDNGTAIYVAETAGSGGGDPEMYDSTFHRNRIALELAAFPPNHGINMYLVVRCKFIDNDCNVKNTSGRSFFMPKNFFVQKDESGNYQAGRPASANRVSFYPVALQTGVANGIPGTDFTDVIPDTDFTLFDYYTDPAPCVSLGFTYNVPFGALNKVFNVFGELIGQNTVSETHYFWIFWNVNP